jgi:hypothetical protein
MFGASVRRLRYPGLVQAGEDISCWFRYLPDDIYPGGLETWCPLNLLARQYFGGHREKEEISRHDIIGHSCRMSI